MEIVSGCVIKRNNKILMVKEAKKICYGRYNFPAGHVDEKELITDAAIREVYEETGCKVKLTGVLPITTIVFNNERTIVRITFTAEILEENIKFDPNEILDVQWVDIEDIKNMTEQELRGHDSAMQCIKDLEDEKIYPLEMFDQKIYTKG